jgi:transcriptional regulator with XRE-family HTH domain
MITMAKRIEQLRTERNLSRPALAATLGFQKMSIEKFETGRQTPSQEQLDTMAAYFGVSVFYLRGENDDRTRMDDWMDGAFMDVEPAKAGFGVRFLPEKRKIQSGSAYGYAGSPADT